MKNETTVLPRSRRVKTLLFLPALLIILLLGTISCGQLSVNRFTDFVDLLGSGRGSRGIAAELDGDIYFRSFGDELWYPADLCRWDGETVETLREDFTGYFLTALDGKIYYTMPDSNEIRRFSPDGTDERFVAYGEVRDGGGNGIMPLWTDSEHLYCVDSHSVGILSTDGTIEKQVELPENAFMSEFRITTIGGGADDNLIYYDRSNNCFYPWLLDLSTGESVPLVSDSSVSYGIYGVRDGKLLSQRNHDNQLLLVDGEREKELSIEAGDLYAANESLIFESRSDSLYLVTEEEEKRIASVPLSYPILVGDTFIFSTWQPADLDGTDTLLTAFCTPSPEDNRFIYAADGEGNLYLLHSANTADETP